MHPGRRRRPDHLHAADDGAIVRPGVINYAGVWDAALPSIILGDGWLFKVFHLDLLRLVSAESPH